MRTKRVICALASVAMFCGIAAANESVERVNLTDAMTDSVVKSRQIIYFGDGEKASVDSINKLILRFYTDQFRHVQDPQAPYFTFMSRDATLAMGIGGCVRMRAYYDWGNVIPAPGFAPYLIPMHQDPARTKAFGTTPAGTSLFFRVIGSNRTLGEYQLYIEANFNGYSARDFHLKKAYAVLNDWTIGYATSTFSDPTALPSTVDASGPNCKMSATSVLVRWMHEFKKSNFTLGASIETPQASADYIAGETENVTQYIPDFAILGQYDFGANSHVRLAGIVRSLPYRDLISKCNHNITGWGVQLTTVYHPTKNITLYGCFNGGKGYAGLGGDWLTGRLDLVNELDTPGRMYAPGAIGGYAAVQYNFTPAFFVSGTFGASRLYEDKPVNGDRYNRGMYVAVNAFYNLTARIQVGAEYNLGFRRNADMQQSHAMRVGAMAQFSF